MCHSITGVIPTHLHQTQIIRLVSEGENADYRRPLVLISRYVGSLRHLQMDTEYVNATIGSCNDTHITKEERVCHMDGDFKKKRPKKRSADVIGCSTLKTVLCR